MKSQKKRRSQWSRQLVIFMIIAVWIYSGVPQIFQLQFNYDTIQIPPKVHMVSAATSSARVVGTTNSNPTGWTSNTVSVANLSTDNNANYAICTSCSTTNYAQLTNFNFAAEIGVGATITSITAVVNGKSSGNTAAKRTAKATLTKDGTTAVGTAKSIAFATTDGNVTTASDLWGTTWTGAEVRASTFGILLADNDSTAGDLQFDYVTLTIVYTNDTTAPTITNVSSDHANGSFKAGEVIDIDVTFSEAVTSTGNVTVTLETGVTDRTCTFTVTAATTGTCNYTVQATDTTSDLTVNTIAGTIADAASNAMTNFAPTTNLAANKAIVIDTTAPTITNVSSDHANGSFKAGEVVDIDVTFSEAVTSTGNVTVTLETGVTDRTCTFTVSAATTGTCNYTVQATDTTSDLTVNTIAGTINDAALNTMTNFVPTTNLAANKAIVIDTTNPTVSTLSPLDNATGVSTTANLVMTFAETVTVNTGDVVIKKTSDNSTIETIAITDAKVTGTGTNTITINPAATLTESTEYYVQVASGALRDGALNSYAGISDTTSWSFTTMSSNTPPTGLFATTSGSGPRDGSAFADDAAVGTVAWGNPSYAQTSNDSRAAIEINDGDATHYLKATGFGFSIPSDVTITGIVAEVEASKSCLGTGTIVDSSIRIYKAGTLSGDDKAGATWGTSDAYSSYGGSADLWGETWTPADINDSGFGLGVSAAMTLGVESCSVRVDHIRITVYYSTAPTQKTDGTGVVDISVTVADTEGNLSKAKLQYANSCTPGATNSGVTNGNTFTNAALGSVSWTSPSNAQLSDDSRATATGIGLDVMTNYLKVTNFGFSIPSAATITGIKAEVERKTLGPCQNGYDIQDNSVMLVQSDTIQGTDLASGTTITGSEAYQTYGGAGQLWGLSWSPSTINASNFGVAYSVVNYGTEVCSADVDHVRITVYYTDGWSSAYAQTPISVTYQDTGGNPDINNSNAYQVGTTASTQIKTASGSNTVEFDWNSATDLPTANGSYCLRLTANDGTVDQSTPATQSLTLDNVNPTAAGSLTSGGSGIDYITLNYGTQALDTNPPTTNKYKMYYKVGASGVTEANTEKDSTDFDSYNYGAHSSITVSTLTDNTSHVFNIWTYDTYGHKANPTEVVLSTLGKPTGSLDAATQKTDGSGYVDLTLTADSPQDRDIRALIEYETVGSGCDGPWAKVSLATTTPSGFTADSGGQPDVVNANAYQLGSTATTRIDTSAGANDGIVSWDSKVDFPGAAQTVCLRLTVNDDLYDQATPSTRTVTIDNVLPTASQASSSKANGSYATGEVIPVTITFSEAVTTTGSATVNLNSGGSCTMALTNESSKSCNYTVQAGDTTNGSKLDVTTVTGTIKDAKGNQLTNTSITGTNISSAKDIYIVLPGPHPQTFSPTDGATGVSVSANLVITFDVATYAGAGNITIKKTSDNSTFETIVASSGNVTGGGTTEITINPTGTLAGDTEYYVQIGGDALADLGDVYYPGISDTTSWSFTTGAGGSPTYSASGSFISSAIDTDSYGSIKNGNALRIRWNQVKPTGCQATLYVEATDTTFGNIWSTTGYTGTGTLVTQDLTARSDLQVKRYFRYGVQLTSCNSNTESASVNNVYLDID